MYSVPWLTVGTEAVAGAVEAVGSEKRSILDLARTSDTLVDKRLVELLLHVAGSARHADINTSLSSIASIDTVADSVAGNVDRLQVTAGIINTALDNKSGAAFRDENVVVGLRTGRVTIEYEELAVVLMALASLSASNGMATDARETEVYTILTIYSAMKPQTRNQSRAAYRQGIRSDQERYFLTSGEVDEREKLR
ncbi:hypothetical protein KCV03_g161, partial [Aureobasidium melanogenum]